jgi:hypothetical protein
MAEMRRKFDQDFRGGAFHDMFCTHSSPTSTLTTASPPRRQQCYPQHVQAPYATSLDVIEPGRS